MTGKTGSFIVFALFLILFCQPAGAAAVRVYGTVTDSCGVRIPRATVMFIAGLDTTATLSDSLGDYEVFLSDSPTGIAEPSAFSLSQNYPNPFNPSTTIQFSLDTPGQVALDIFSITGQHVRTLVNGYTQSGLNRVIWDGRDENGMNAASGVYLYRLRAGRQVAVKKMLLMEGGMGVGTGVTVGKKAEEMGREYEIRAEKGSYHYYYFYNIDIPEFMNSYSDRIKISLEQREIEKNIMFSDKYQPYSLLFDSGHFRHEFTYPGDSVTVVMVSKHEALLPEEINAELFTEKGDRENINIFPKTNYRRYYTYPDNCPKIYIKYNESLQKKINTDFINSVLPENAQMEVSFPSDRLRAVYYYSWGDSICAEISVSDSLTCFEYEELWGYRYVLWNNKWYREGDNNNTNDWVFLINRGDITFINSIQDENKLNEFLQDYPGLIKNIQLSEYTFSFTIIESKNIIDIAKKMKNDQRIKSVFIYTRICNPN